jgi:hypothetical protein
VSTGNYAPEVAQLITAPHAQRFRAVAIDPTADAPLQLRIRDARVAWDETSSPRVMASLTCAADSLDELEQLAALDPRAGVRVQLEAGYVLEGGLESVDDLANLGLRRVTVSRPEGTALLELASDEALVVDGSPAVNAAVTASTHVAAINTLIGQCISPPPLLINTVAGPAVTVDPVTDRWATIADLADRIGAQCFDDGTRTWHLDAAPKLAAEPVHVMTSGPGGTLTDTTDSIDRDAWANYVTHVYEWRDSAGADKRVQATALVTQGTYKVTGDAGKRISLDRRSVPTTQAEANAAAANVLARQLTRSTAQTVVGVSAYWLRAGHTVRTTTPRGTTDRIVSRVVFAWPAGTMEVTSRREDVTTIDTDTPVVTTTTPPAAPSTPDPAPAPKVKYVTRWKAAGHATYRGTGVKHTYWEPDQIAFGYVSSTNGNQTGLLLFTGANSTGGETGKTIGQALAGATVHRIRLRATATDFYSFAGGDVRFGYAAGVIAEPATFKSARPYVTVSSWGVGDRRTVELTSSALATALKGGTTRAITVGPGSSSSPVHYGKLGVSAANMPELEIEYSK